MAKKAKYYVRPDGLHETIRVIDKEGHRKAFRGRTDREVDQKILAWQSQMQEKTLFSAVADAWWEEKEPTVAYNSTKNYIPAIRRAKEHFGDRPVSKITASDINIYLRDFSRRGYSAKTAATQLQIIRQILDYAAIHDMIPANPASVVKTPRGMPRVYRQAPTTAEIEKIKSMRSTREGLLPYLIYMTGCRYGEALGLRWEDVDRGKKLICICRSVYFVGRTPNIKTPKTAAGSRCVPLLDALAEILPNKKTGYIFSDDGGKTPMNKTAADNLYKSFKLAAGVSMTAHQIRHGYATALLDAGVEPKVAQTLLGHAQLATTMDIYTHVRDDKIASAAEKMNASF